MSDKTITVNAGVLAGALHHIRATVGKRQTLPILHHVLIEIADSRLMLTGNNLETQLTIGVPVHAATEFAVTVDALKLTDIASHMPEDGDLTLTATDKCLVVRHERGRYRLNTLPVAEFPKIDPDTISETLDMPERQLLALLNEVEPAIAVNDVRTALNGALLAIQGSDVRTVATDGHRLMLSQTTNGNARALERSVVLPRTAVGLITRLLSTSESTVTVGLSGNHFQIRKDGWCLTGKLLDGQFPSYQRVIPPESAEPAHINRQSFREFLTRCLVLAPTNTHAIVLQFSDDTMTVEVKDQDGEECHDSLAIRYHGPEITIGVNGRYLLDALETLGGEDVQMSLKDSNSAMRLTGIADSTVAVVMPMRV